MEGKNSNNNNSINILSCRLSVTITLRDTGES